MYTYPKLDMYDYTPELVTGMETEFLRESLVKAREIMVDIEDQLRAAKIKDNVDPHWRVKANCALSAHRKIAIRLKKELSERHEVVLESRVSKAVRLLHGVMKELGQWELDDDDQVLRDLMKEYEELYPHSKEIES